MPAISDCLRFFCLLRSHQFDILFPQQFGDGVRDLGSVLVPILNAIYLEFNNGGITLRIVVAKLLDISAITWLAMIGSDEVVEWRKDLTMTM